MFRADIESHLTQILATHLAFSLRSLLPTSLLTRKSVPRFRRFPRVQTRPRLRSSTKATGTAGNKVAPSKAAVVPKAAVKTTWAKASTGRLVDAKAQAKQKAVTNAETSTRATSKPGTPEKKNFELWKNHTETVAISDRSKKFSASLSG